MEPSRWWIMSIRAAFLESEPTWYHGAVGVSVWTIISSLAREYSSHLVMDSRSVGEGRAAIRATRGERYSVIRLMVPPLPAASRPSKMITIRAPVPRTHCCSFASSPWRRYISVSYVLLEILATWWGSGTSLTPAPCGDFLAMVQRIPAATRRGAGSDGIARRPEQRLTPPMTATPHGGPPRPAAPAGEYCDASLAHLLDLVTENAAEFHVTRSRRWA